MTLADSSHHCSTVRELAADSVVALPGQARPGAARLMRFTFLGSPTCRRRLPLDFTPRVNAAAFASGHRQTARPAEDFSPPR
jgi:hypothetical protein